MKLLLLDLESADLDPEYKSLSPGHALDPPGAAYHKGMPAGLEGPSTIHPCSLRQCHRMDKSSGSVARQTFS